MKSRGTTSALAFAMVFASSTAGCSLLFTNGPTAEAATSPAPIPPDCSTSRIPPIADTTLATFQAVHTGLAIGASDSVYDESPISREVDIGLGITWVAVYAASAVYGFYNTSACDDAQRKAQKTVVVQKPMRLERTPELAEPPETKAP